MNKIKKYLKIILINILLTILVVVFFDLILYISVLAQNKKYEPHNLLRYNFTINNIQNEEILPYRTPCGLNYNKKPILIYGCSYAYGYKLKEEEHIGYLLSKLTKRPVYNFAVIAAGLQHNLYLLQNQQKIEPEPEYIIYLYIQDHIRRMYMGTNVINSYKFFEYKNKKGKFQTEKGLVNYLKNTVIYQYIVRCFIFHKINDDENFNLLKTYLKEMKQEINIKYPNSKFIFIIYDKKNDIALKLTKEKQKEIQDLGIKVIDLDDIFGDKLYKPEYTISETDAHPNAKAWKLIAPQLVKIEKL